MDDRGETYHINRIKEGDRDAFSWVVDQYKDMVFKTAYLTIGNVQEAEDILQEVFLKVYESAGTFDPNKGSMSTWLHRITVNHCISGRRKKRLPTVKATPRRSQ